MNQTATTRTALDVTRARAARAALYDAAFDSVQADNDLRRAIAALEAARVEAARANAALDAARAAFAAFDK